MKNLKDLAPKFDTQNVPKLSQDELLLWYAQRYNDEEGDLNKEDGIDCECCKNKGFIMKVVYQKIYGEKGTVVVTCKCMAQRKLARKAINSGLGEYLNKRSSDYIVTEEWQKNCFSKMVNFCKNESTSDKWFIACGQSGSGKTLLCSIIANHMLYNLNKSVLYITWTDFISKLKRDIMSDHSNSVSEYLDYIKKCEVLFIDELLKKYTEADLKYIVEIINYRYTNNLKTIITSERTIDELLDIDEATFGRVIEKCDNYILNIEKDRKKNFRLKNLYN